MEPVPQAYFEANGVRGSRHSIAISSSVSASAGDAAATAASASSAASIELVWSGSSVLVGDDLVQLAGAVLGALADRRRRLAADLAGRRLALAELAHVGDGGGRGRYGFGGADLRQLVRFRRLFPGQQHEHEPEPECHAKQKNISRPRSSLMVVLRLNRSFVPD